MLNMKDVTYVTGPPLYRKIISGINLSIAPGEDTLIKGANGSGKSTLVSLMMKIKEPSDGKIKGGNTAASCVYEDIDNQLLFSTVREEMDTVRNYPRSREAAERFQLAPHMNKTTFELSYSQKARLMFAVSWSMPREYFIVDSPPFDSIIDSILEEELRSDRRTLVLLLPEGDPRAALKGFSRRLSISGGKIIEGYESAN